MKLTPTGTTHCLWCRQIIAPRAISQHWERFFCSVQCKQRYAEQLVQAGHRAVERRKFRQSEAYNPFRSRRRGN